MRITIKLILILALASTPAVAANLFVPSQFGTIQAAVDAASPGDRILVAAGPHAGAVIDKWVKISGVGDATLINDGPIFGPFHDAFRLFPGADKTEISDLKIELSGAVGLQRFGIFAGPSGDPTAIRVAVHNVTFANLNTAISIQNTSGWRITDNIIDGLREHPNALLSTGITVSGSGNCLVANNTIIHNSAGTSGKIYIGINLSASAATGQTENNKVVNNTISVVAAPAFDSDIELFNGTVATCDGPTPISVFDNKVIQNHAENPRLTPSCLIDHNVIH